MCIIMYAIIFNYYFINKAFVLFIPIHPSSPLIGTGNVKENKHMLK